MTPPAVSIDNVTVRYGEVVALDDVTITIGSGGIAGLLGANGSGKSTLFKTVMGLITPQAGAVSIEGARPNRARRRGVIAYVPQSEQVDWTFPVRVVDVVMMGRYGQMGFTRRPRRADHVAVRAALERTGLVELADRQIGALSGGQRKRAFVARAIAQQGRVLLLDEPFAGVDKRSETELIEVLRGLADEGHTVVVSTHDLGSVPSFCDEAIMIQQRVIAQGDPGEVLAPEVLAAAFGLDVAWTGDVMGTE